MFRPPSRPSSVAALSLFFACSAAFSLSQLPGSNPTPSGCRIERRSGSYPLAPVLAGPFQDVLLQSELTQAYGAMAGRNSNSASQLRGVLYAARVRSNRCAEALAAYALGSLSRTNNVAAAGEWFRQAEALFREIDSPTGLAHTHFELAALTSKTRSAAEVSAAFRAAAQEFEDIGDPIDALSARIQAVNSASSDAPQQYNLLIVEARRLQRTGLEARIHQSWGDSLFTRGLYDEALHQYQTSDALYIACRCDPDERAYLQTSMGRLERTQGRPEAALPHYRLALSLQHLARDPSFLPQTLNAISVAYEAMHNYSRAIAYVQQALVVANKIHSQQFIDFLEANLGYLYYQSGKPARGLALLERATAHLGNDYQRCTRLSQLAELYNALHESAQALAAITRSIKSCERDHDNRNLADSLEARARYRLRSGGSLDDALADARRSLALLEEIRSHLVPEDAHKRGYNQASRTTYETTLALLTRMGRSAEALEITELSRARAFLDLLSAPRSPSEIASPPTQNPLFAEASLPIRGGSATSLPSSRLLASESHVSTMESDEILSTARQLHTTLLAFWIAHDQQDTKGLDDRLYTWVVAPSSPIHATSQPVRLSELQSLVGAANPSRAQGDKAAVDRALHRLYQILIAPVAPHLPVRSGSLVTIVPYGPLFQLSFAALLDPRGHYLVERYALDTTPAVSLLRYTERNESEASKHPSHFLLLAAPRHMPQLRSLSLPPLPGSADEVHAIAHALPPEEVTLLEGSHANASELVQDLSQATVLHFATHAIVSGTNPFGSFLALDREGDSSGLLTTASIYTLHLHTHLVVLSACRTGLGPISADGVAGLSRAFIYAGSASVLTALWDVADQPTAILMPLFYRNLSQGQSRAQALRSAQLELIAQLRAGKVRVPVAGSLRSLPEDPAYWAAFSLSGQP